MNCGIYSITAPNGDCYIGASCRIRGRWAQHVFRLSHGTHFNAGLQKAWNVHGREAMKFEVVLLCSRDMLPVYEQAVIDARAPAFNVRIVASSNAGLVATAETRAKMSAVRKGRVLSEEHRQKLSAARKGKTFTDEHRASLRAARAGRIVTDATKAKLKASAQAYWAAKVQP